MSKQRAKRKKQRGWELNLEIIGAEAMAECGRGRIHCEGQSNRTGDQGLSPAWMWQRVCGARYRAVSTGLKECTDVTNGSREVENFKG